MDLEWKRKPISNLFRRNGGQSDNKAGRIISGNVNREQNLSNQIDAQGASIEQEATSNMWALCQIFTKDMHD